MGGHAWGSFIGRSILIPVVINETTPFPFRNLILFITFIVILVTLVFQGLTLPWLIRKVRPEEASPATKSAAETELIIQERLADAGLAFLKGRQTPEMGVNPHYQNLLERVSLDHVFASGKMKGVVDEDNLHAFRQIYLDLLQRQRAILQELNREDGFDEAQIRKYTALVDIEEWKLRERLPEG
ncbi:hypothetical protein SAMN05444008_102425 [Cnuella takakiae]|uniref:Monovalent cation:H+ antiporter, CPA1 family n=2 Tax=Cnuella takakiae TaxID=1302690 RepID=A0A1M4VYF9_9BACT|nr:hypothetical protein [Cnuella takakiae]SHE73996.1 hypothetical protein SAMN05444008_102425 [Cnuella takakiae]